jgi:excinuclease ABC subunit A
VIDLGPGGGVNGGKVIAEGPPETIAAVAISATGQYLRPMLERASVKPKMVETKPKKPSRPRRIMADEPDELNLVAAAK